MTIELEYVINPAWCNDAHTAINMSAKFSHQDVFVPFTATLDDTEAHGRITFARVASGEFGDIAPYIPPTPLEVASRDNPIKRQRELAHASAKAQHWDMMGNTTQATAWRSYYQQLYALTQAPDWPLVEQWPTAPELVE